MAVTVGPNSFVGSLYALRNAVNGELERLENVPLPIPQDVANACFFNIEQAYGRLRDVRDGFQGWFAVVDGRPCICLPPGVTYTVICQGAPDKSQQQIQLLLPPSQQQGGNTQMPQPSTQPAQVVYYIRSPQPQ